MMEAQKKKKRVDNVSLEKKSPEKKVKPTSSPRPEAEFGPNDFENMEKCMELDDHVNKLLEFQEKLHEYTKSVPLTEHLKFLAFHVDMRIRALRLQEDKTQAAAVAQPPRVENIDYKIKSAVMEYWRDYENFEKRIEDVFKWHKNGKNTYLAPYFAMVQSSGMGKTKLMYEYKKRHSDKCLLLLCRDPYVRQTNDLLQEVSVFDEVLVLETNVHNFENERNRILTVLEGFIETKLTGLKENDKVVLFLDEAEFLLKANEGFAFRVIRWWIRRNALKVRLVLVLAGTDLNLWNFTHEDAQISSFSRNSCGGYNSGAELYPPFFELTTVGLEMGLKDTLNSKTDFDHAVKFGRPLFAHMAAENPLDENKLQGILRRLLLGKQASDDLSNESCLSVLGTRVQMGQTTLQISTELVAHGYACLMNISSMKSTKLAHICFFPDPVCAYLAMNLMFPIKKAKIFGNKDPKFWTTEATKMFLTGLCRPGKADIGLVTTALYLLFCGDVLRASKVDPKVFAVSLCDMLRLAAKPSYKLLEESDAPTAYVSFIQVCRNNLRHSVKELSLARNEYLKEWFIAGCAFYAHPFCQGYDIIAPVRVVKSNEDFYYPMLISMKNQVCLTPQERKNALERMENLLMSTDDKIGVCVLLLIGLPPELVFLETTSQAAETNNQKGLERDSGTVLKGDTPPPDYAAGNLTRNTPVDIKDPKKVIDTDEAVLTKVTNWKGDTILLLTIVVPKGDCFGCWNMAVEGALEGSTDAEIYASHVVAHQTEGALSKAEQLLCS